MAMSPRSVSIPGHDCKLLRPWSSHTQQPFVGSTHHCWHFYCLLGHSASSLPGWGMENMMLMKSSEGQGLMPRFLWLPDSSMHFNSGNHELVVATMIYGFAVDRGSWGMENMLLLNAYVRALVRTKSHCHVISFCACTLMDSMFLRCG
mmetsp:Transcript_130474/g.254263  ORF Transcript_130474/g.254263 Transcript_130474/m.254263 type:complete len:148 (+) Transcript_130474:20-463(+)